MCQNKSLLIKMSSNDSCVTEVTAAISRIRTSATTEDIQSNGDFKSEGSSNPSPAESPFPTIRFQSLGDSDSHDASIFRCPIIGHEVMEERARFTVYKLRVENQSTGECWFVFRRYTDFVRLHSKLKVEFPSLELPLPRKRWFGDNFNPSFIEERAQGLQGFVDNVLKNGPLQLSLNVREFFCLDEPPCAVDSIDESRAIFEALEETLQQLRGQLVEKDLNLETTREALMQQTLENERLRKLIKNCSQCSREATSALDPLSYEEDDDNKI